MEILRDPHRTRIVILGLDPAIHGAAASPGLTKKFTTKTQRHEAATKRYLFANLRVFVVNLPCYFIAAASSALGLFFVPQRLDQILRAPEGRISKDATTRVQFVHMLEKAWRAWMDAARPAYYLRYI